MEIPFRFIPDDSSLLTFVSNVIAHVIHSTSQMHRYGITIDYNRLRRRLILWLAFVTTLLSVSIASVYYWFSSSLTDDQIWIAFVLLFIAAMKQGILLSIVTSYVYLIMNMKCRFDTLSKSMA